MNIKSYKHMRHIKKVYQLHEDVIIRLLDLKRIYSFKNEELHDYKKKKKKELYRDKFLYNSLIENESILYSVEPNGYDVDAFAIHVIKKLDDESLKIIGHEKGAFGRKPMEYNISKLFTKEEVKKQFDIDLV